MEIVPVGRGDVSKVFVVEVREPDLPPLLDYVWGPVHAFCTELTNIEEDPDPCLWVHGPFPFFGDPVGSSGPPPVSDKGLIRGEPEDRVMLLMFEENRLVVCCYCCCCGGDAVVWRRLCNSSLFVWIVSPLAKLYLYCEPLMYLKVVAHNWMLYGFECMLYAFVCCGSTKYECLVLFE